MMLIHQVCLLTADAPRLRRFYETVLETRFEGDDTHASFRVAGLSLVLYDRRAARVQMGLDPEGSPVTRPWGARSFQIRDPEGNVVGFVRPPG